MTKILFFLIIIQLFSCSEKNKKSQSKKFPEKNQTALNNKKNAENEISPQEQDFNKFIESIEAFRIEPIDTLMLEYYPKQIESYNIGRNTIQIFKKDSLNIDWIKINSKKLNLKNLKTINPRVDGKSEELFCNSIQKIKLYKFKNAEIIFIELANHPCNGLGCSVSDYLIYDLTNKQINHFGNFRTADVDFYKFPFNNKISYISTEFQGDFQGATPMHYISRIYSLNKKGKFQLQKDSVGNAYYYETITFPNVQNKEFEYNRNWFN